MKRKSIIMMLCFYPLLRHIVTPKQFREIQAALGWTHPDTARELGLSLVSVKRIATGKQVITDQTARALVGMLLINDEGLTKKFAKLLDKYHDDTRMSTD